MLRGHHHLDEHLGAAAGAMHGGGFDASAVGGAWTISTLNESMCVRWRAPCSLLPRPGGSLAARGESLMLGLTYCCSRVRDAVWKHSTFNAKLGNERVVAERDMA